MKIQLDYDTNTLTLENSVSLGDFINKIQAILPDWEMWRLNTTLNTVWTSPVYVGEPRPWWEQQTTTTYVNNPTDPYSIPIHYDGTASTSNGISNDSVELNNNIEPTSGTYCLEI